MGTILHLTQGHNTFVFLGDVHDTAPTFIHYFPHFWVWWVMGTILNLTQGHDNFWFLGDGHDTEPNAGALFPGRIWVLTYDGHDTAPNAGARYF